MPRVSVIGIGNTLMGDDGVGVRIAETLRERALPAGVEIVVGSVAGMSLVGHLLASERVIFADAIDAGHAVGPGAIFRFHPDDAGVTQLRSNTIHGMSVGYLVTTARLSGARPDVLVYAVQVGDVRFAPDVLTPPVLSAVAETADLIEAELNAST